MILAVLLALATVPTVRAGTVIEKVEAAANQSIILLSDVDRFRRDARLRVQLDPLFAGTIVAQKGAEASVDEIVEFLIDERLILQQFPVADAEVEQEISSIQVANQMDRQGLRTMLGDQGFRFEDYFELIRAGTAKRNLIEREIRTKVVVSDEDVRNFFYNRYARSAAIPLTYRIQLIAVDPGKRGSAAAAREAIEQARRRVVAGEDFGAVAKEISDDPNASQGGELGTFAEDQLNPLIREQVKKLRIGDISPVFGGAPGALLMLKLMDVKSGDEDRLRKVKEEIRAQIATAEYQRQIALWLERQRAAAFVRKAGSSALPSSTR